MDPMKKIKEGGKKKVMITVEVKKDIIEKHERGMRVVDIAKFYNKSTSTICTILKKKEEIMGLDGATGITRISKQRPRVLDDVEKLLVVRINEKQLAGDPVTENFVCEKAKVLYADLVSKLPGTSTENQEDFKASRGWFDNFKRRSGYTSLKASQPNDISTDEISIKIEPLEGGVSTDSILEDPTDGIFQSETAFSNKRKNDDEIILDDTNKPSGKKPRTGNEDTFKSTRGYAPRYTLNAINDECNSFGKYVSDKLRCYSTKTRCALQHAISNIIFSADQGFLENYQTNEENILGTKNTTLPFESVNVNGVVFSEPAQMQQTAPTSPAASGGSHESANSSDEFDSESLDFTDLV